MPQQKAAPKPQPRVYVTEENFDYSSEEDEEDITPIGAPVQEEPIRKVVFS